MIGGWVKKQNWKVSHFIKYNDQRPRHHGNEVGQAVCGYFIVINEKLEDEPTGIDTCTRCDRCERRLRQAFEPREQMGPVASIEQASAEWPADAD